MGGSRFMNGLSAPDENGNQQPVKNQPAPPPPPPPTPEQDFEEQVRQRLLQDARARFTEIAPLSRDEYSATLDKQGQAITKYMRREQNSDNAQAVLLDPNEFTAGVAIGMADRDVAKSLMAAHGGAPDGETAEDISRHMRKLFHLPYGAAYSNSYAPDPHAHTDLFSKEAGVCVVAPVSGYPTPDFRIPGLTYQQNVDFINFHEGWHCRDTENKFDPADRTKLAGFSGDNLTDALGSRAKLDAVVVANRQESLADAGSAGDLIRNGADPKTIEAVIDWRKADKDPLHMTIGALRDLQQRIDEMGVDNFRKLDNEAAHKIYTEAVNAGAIDRKMAESVIRYSSDGDDRRDIEAAAAKGDAHAKAVMDFVKPYNLPDPDAKPQGMKTTPLSPEEKKLADQLRQFMPKEQLLGRAFEDGGKITPETLTKAYGELQESLRKGIERDPDNKLLPAEAVKLQESFVFLTKNLDYVVENAQRGVNILEKEPALKDLSPQGGATKPDAEAAPAAKISDASGTTTRARRPTMGM